MPDSVRTRAKSVLIIEDDEASQFIFSTILDHSGYRTLSARSAEEAARLLAEDTADLVIMDIGLPHVDGFTLTERIRADPRTQDLPVLVVTVHVFPDDVRRAENAGCTDFMAKPADPMDVLERVIDMIGPPLDG